MSLTIRDPKQCKPVAAVSTGLRVIVAGDDDFARDLLLTGLQSAGIGCASAPDVAALLANLSDASIGAVILCPPLNSSTPLEILRHIRESPRGGVLPVVVIGNSCDRRALPQLVALGLSDYVLKKGFRLEAFVQRLRVRAGAARTPVPVAAPKTVPAAAVAIAPPVPKLDASPNDAVRPGASGPTMSAPSSPAESSPLTGAALLEHLRQHVEGRALAGVASKLILVAGSSRSDIGEIVELLRKDPYIAGKVLSVANSAAYANNRSNVTTIEDAVKKVGMTSVRNIALAVGVFEAIRGSGEADFDPILCWQHCLATATILGVISAGAPEVQEYGYTIGLCHDLAPMILQLQFPSQYAAASAHAAASGCTLAAAIGQQFGMPHSELTGSVLSSMGLPVPICKPIKEFFADAENPHRAPLSSSAMLLSVAHELAHGLLLADTGELGVSPVLKSALKRAASAAPTSIDGPAIRSEISAFFLSMGQLSRADEARLTQPLFAKIQSRAAYLRHSAYAELDPLRTALESLFDSVGVGSADPSPAPQDADCIVIARPSISSAEILQLEKTHAQPTLVVLPSTAQVPDAAGMVQFARAPVALRQMHEFASSSNAMLAHSA